jgi:hypothetical protein
MILFELIWNTVQRQVAAMFSVVDEFECIEDLWSKFTLVDVIVLRCDMDNKLDTALLATLGHRLDLLHINLPLNLVLLDIIE